MLKQKNKPTALWFQNPGYVDISFEMLDFGRDSYNLALDAGQYFYYGNYKPFKAVYVEMGTVVNAVSTALVIEYFDGSSWVAVSGAVDETKAFTRSGFIQFDRPSDWASTTVNSIDAYYLRASVPVTLTAGMLVQGINVLFSDDRDLIGVYPTVMDYLSAAETTFVLRHQNSRDLIMQDLRNHGMVKSPAGSGRYDQLEPFDVLEVDEVRLWSTYLTLSNIFSSLQAREGDFYKEKSEEYRGKAEFYKAATYLSLDKDDNGLLGSTESALSITTKRLVRG